MRVINITIIIHYDETSVDGYLESNVRRAVERCLEEGVMTPTGEEIVDEYCMDVIEVVP